MLARAAVLGEDQRNKGKDPSWGKGTKVSLGRVWETPGTIAEYLPRYVVCMIQSPERVKRLLCHLVGKEQTTRAGVTVAE